MQRLALMQFLDLTRSLMNIQFYSYVTIASWSRSWRHNPQQQLGSLVQKSRSVDLSRVFVRKKAIGLVYFNRSQTIQPPIFDWNSYALYASYQLSIRLKHTYKGLARYLRASRGHWFLNSYGMTLPTFMIFSSSGSR